MAHPLCIPISCLAAKAHRKQCCHGWLSTELLGQSRCESALLAGPNGPLSSLYQWLTSVLAVTVTDERAFPLLVVFSGVLESGAWGFGAGLMRLSSFSYQGCWCCSCLCVVVGLVFTHSDMPTAGWLCLWFRVTAETRMDKCLPSWSL